jgi:hypothetical protein
MLGHQPFAPLFDLLLTLGSWHCTGSLLPFFWDIVISLVHLISVAACIILPYDFGFGQKE